MPPEDDDLPNGLFDPKPGEGANPDERDPAPRTSRRYRHARSLAANADLEDAAERGWTEMLAFFDRTLHRAA